MYMERAGLNSALTSIPATAAKPSDPKLERSAHQFEASLMAELSKPLQESDGLTGDGDAGEGSGGALAGFASESLAQAISERGGFGIAARILRQLEPSQSPGKKVGNGIPAALKFSARPPI